jgi:hypothetical protein
VLQIRAHLITLVWCPICWHSVKGCEGRVKSSMITRTWNAWNTCQKWVTKLTLEIMSNGRGPNTDNRVNKQYVGNKIARRTHFTVTTADRTVVLCVVGPVEGCFNKSRVNRCFLEVVQRQLLQVAATAPNTSPTAGWIYEVSNEWRRNDMQRDQNGYYYFYVICIYILKDKMFNDLKYPLDCVGNAIF